MKNLLIPSLMLIFLTISIHAKSENIIFDSFESGDKSATNNYGFSWSDTTVTSVVNTLSDEEDNGNSWESMHGKHSLKFLYRAGKSWTEQRFTLGQGYQEIWIRYWIRVPLNFEHGSESPNNNKFFAMWMDAYSGKGEGATVFWNFWRDSDGGSSITVAYNPGNHSSSGGQAQKKKFIKIPEDRGRWMQVVLNLKASSSTTSTDGYIGMWRRWEDERNFTQLHEVENITLKTPAGGPNGWTKGYLMGWANATYKTDTEWLIDSFEVATNSLLTTYDSRVPNPPEIAVE